MQHALFIVGQKTGKAINSEVDLLYYFTLPYTDSKTKGKQTTKRYVDRRRLSRSRFPSFN